MNVGIGVIVDVLAIVGMNVNMGVLVSIAVGVIVGVLVGLNKGTPWQLPIFEPYSRRIANGLHSESYSLLFDW